MELGKNAFEPDSKIRIVNSVVWGTVKTSTDICVGIPKIPLTRSRRIRIGFLSGTCYWRNYTKLHLEVTTTLLL